MNEKHEKILNKLGAISDETAFERICFGLENSWLVLILQYNVYYLKLVFRVLELFIQINTVYIFYLKHLSLFVKIPIKISIIPFILSILFNKIKYL